MERKRLETSLENKYNEFLQGLRKSDRELFREMLSEIESHHYMFSSVKSTVIEDLLLGLLLNQKRIRKLNDRVKSIEKTIIK